MNFKVKHEQACLEESRKKASLIFLGTSLGLALRLTQGKALSKPDETEFSKFSDDELHVRQPRIINSRFEPDANAGISSFRPEILSILNFKTIYDGDPKRENFTSAGQLIEAQWQASKIREESLSELYTSMKDRGLQDQTEADSIYRAMQTNFFQTSWDTERARILLSNFINGGNDVAARFNIKKTLKDRVAPGFLDLKSYYVQHMGFTEEQFDSFSNTKIFVQMLSDFRQTLENYSFNLLDTVDPDRTGDVNPTSIDRTVSLSDGFSFTSAFLRSEATPINATDRTVSDRFLQALPSDPVDRIKVLINFLSKEYRISAALGKENYIKNDLRDDWGAGTTGSPFDNIIGVAGDTIFDSPVGDRALINLGYENVILTDQAGSAPGEVTVLPFEEKYVDSEDNRDFIPGSAHYIDSLWDLDRADPDELKFNTGPIKEYVDRFTLRNIKAKNIISNLLLIDEEGQPRNYDIQPETVFDRFASSLMNSLKEINDEDDNVSPERSGEAPFQVFTIAMFRLANQDTKLKNYLFQYLILMGILSNLDNNPGAVWADVARELGDIKNLSIIQVPNSFNGTTSLLEAPINVVAPLMKGVANKIHLHVRRKLLGGQLGTARQRSLAHRNPELTRRAVSRFARQGKRAFSRLGIPVASAIGTQFIESALLQIANDTIFDKTSNLFREFVDTASFLTDGIGGEGHQEYLLDDDSGRTRYNFVSTSHQLFVIFEIMSAMTAVFANSDFIQQGLDITIQTNKALSSYAASIISNMVGNRFNQDRTTLGGFSKKLRAELGGVSDPAVFVDRFTGEDRLPSYADIRETLKGVETGIPNRRSNPDNPLVATAGSNNRPARHTAEHRYMNATLENIRQKLQAENHLAFNILWFLQNIAGNLTTAKTLATHLSTKSLNKLLGPGSRFISLKDLRILKDPAQIQLLGFLNDELQSRAKNAFSNSDVEIGTDFYSKFRNPIITNSLSEEAKEAVYAYLKEPLFQKESATVTKIFSVGVPAQFIRNTQDRINRTEINSNSFKKKEADVITVNVHKRDLRRPELIFKPQKFLFDMSLFQREADVMRLIMPQAGETHSALRKRNVLQDYSNASTAQAYTAARISKLEKYSFLRKKEKAALFSNHYESFLLETYIRLATGLSINEKRFTIDATPPSEVMDVGFEALLLSYMKDIQGEDIPSGQSIQELLDNPDVAGNVKDTIISMTSGNVLTTPLTERDRIIKPKKFDRVLHFAVNIDDFEIDVEEMRTTPVGKDALKKAAYSNEFVVRRHNEKPVSVATLKFPLFMKKRSDRDIIFEDFFVTLESTNDT